MNKFLTNTFRVIVAGFHVIVACVIVFVLWAGSAQAYVQLFGADKMAILVAAIGMIIGGFLAIAYIGKYFK